MLNGGRLKGLASTSLESIFLESLLLPQFICGSVSKLTRPLINYARLLKQTFLLSGEKVHLRPESEIPAVPNTPNRS